MIINYKINNVEYSVEASDNQNFKYGDDIVLSNAETDITYNTNWYSDGYTNNKFLINDEFYDLKNGISNTISNLITNEIGIDTNGFTLDNYHKYIKTNEHHFKVVSKTRDLYAYDFGFNIKELIPKFSEIIGLDLTDRIPNTNIDEHIIVRINRPKSNDYNPPHKDMYEGYDSGKNFEFVNLWVPIAGVTNKTSLPIAPKSHRISENSILRTIDGGQVGKNKYRVCLIKEWGGNSDLIRTNVNYGEVLMFSSHMIHGLAINEEDNVTRVALEFRLFKK